MKVKLLKSLENAGVRFEPGQTVDLDPDTAQWVIDQGVGEAKLPKKSPLSAPAVQDKE